MVTASGPRLGVSPEQRMASFLITIKDKFIHSFSGKLILSVGSMLIIGNFFLIKFLLHEGRGEHLVAIIIYLMVFEFFFCLGLCIALLLWVKRPLVELLKAINTVAKGNFDYEIPVESQDELGDLAASFNFMTRQLSTAKESLMEWAQTLEEKVEEKTEEIHRAQDSLIHSEKLASLGRMAAGVAHELNSPLTGVVTFGHLMRDRFPEGSQDREDIEVIIEQANRCANIIRGLLGFARASSEEKELANLNDVIQSSLKIVRNKADFLNIRVELELAESLPRVPINAPQIQQVFLNMIVNAADAMEGRGVLTIRSWDGEEDGRPCVLVEFRDTGPGISPGDMEKLFEPFFTTKPVGRGTGLGLAVSHGLIKDHGGHIRVSSKPGEGASFVVSLPLEGGGTV